MEGWANGIHKTQNRPAGRGAERMRDSEAGNFCSGWGGWNRTGSVRPRPHWKSLDLCRSEEPGSRRQGNASEGTAGAMQGNRKSFGEIIEILLFACTWIPGCQEPHLPASHCPRLHSQACDLEQVDVAEEVNWGRPAQSPLARTGATAYPAPMPGGSSVQLQALVGGLRGEIFISYAKWPPSERSNFSESSERN